MNDTLNIYLVEKTRKVYLFEELNNKDTLYYMATPIDNVFQFDLMTTYCNQYKTLEPIYDKVDYLKMKNQAGF